MRPLGSLSLPFRIRSRRAKPFLVRKAGWHPRLRTDSGSRLSSPAPHPDQSPESPWPSVWRFEAKPVDNSPSLMGWGRRWDDPLAPLPGMWGAQGHFATGACPKWCRLFLPPVASTKGFVAHEPGLSRLWGNRSHLSGSGRRWIERRRLCTLKSVLRKQWLKRLHITKGL